MTDKIQKILPIVTLVSVLLLGLFVYSNTPKKVSGDPQLGATGNMLAEDYISYVRYNDGYNSAKDFTISGAASFTGAVTLSGATTLGSTTATSLKVGATSTLATMFRFGTCNLGGANTSHAASSTVAYSCLATGVAPGDKVFVTLATSSSGVLTSGLIGSVYVQGAVATSSDSIAVGIYNGTGGAIVLSAPGMFSGIASSTQWQAWR